jgi:hypothetical protein
MLQVIRASGDRGREIIALHPYVKGLPRTPPGWTKRRPGAAPRNWEVGSVYFNALTAQVPPGDMYASSFISFIGRFGEFGDPEDDHLSGQPHVLLS